MPNDVPIMQAQMVGLFVESVFWGFLLISLAFCLNTLLISKDGGLKPLAQIRWPMLIVALTLTGIATFDVILQLVRNIEAFIYYTGEGGALEVFQEISDWINITKVETFLMQTTIGDAVLIYRLWIIYGKIWLPIILPSMLWLGGVAVQIYIIYLQSTLHTQQLVSASRITPAMTSFVALTIGLTVISTSLIVYRIWKVDSANRRFSYQTNSSPRKSVTRLGWVMRVIVESGLMYTIISVITFATTAANNTAAYGTSDVEVQVIGIAFNLIIVRAARYPDSIYSQQQSSTGRTLAIPVFHHSSLETGERDDHISRPAAKDDVELQLHGDKIRVDVTTTRSATHNDG